MPFLACGQCITDIFVTETQFVDRFVGHELWVWGQGSHGMLGVNSILPRSSPVQTISGGTNWKCQCNIGLFSGGIKTDGTLWMWGCNTDGTLATNSVVFRSSPVQTVSGGTNWRDLYVGTSGVASIKTDGTLWLWGRNPAGVIGDNTVITRSSPVQTISGGTNWYSASISDSVGAIKTDGTLWLWGCNSSGKIGDNTVINRSSPVQAITGGTNWKSVSVNAFAVGAIKTDGTLWLWGSGTNGELGNNSVVSRSSPVQTISGGTNWKSISVGSSSVAAIKNDGTLWVWGSNLSGQLGTNNLVTAAQSSPVQTVSGGTNWRTVTAGTSNMAAIKTDGTLWLWGTNTNGTLGDVSVITRSSPVQTVTTGSYWRSVSIGGGTLALGLAE